MKTILTILCLALATTGHSQSPGPDPPPAGSWHDLRLAHQLRRLRQPAPMPTGGWWVVEDRAGHTAPTIVRFYNASQQEIHADTLRHKYLILSRRSVIDRLNTRLRTLLARQPAPLLAL